MKQNTNNDNDDVLLSLEQMDFSASRKQTNKIFTSLQKALELHRLRAIQFYEQVITSR